jgi:hypothetical protein
MRKAIGGAAAHMRARVGVLFLGGELYCLCMVGGVSGRCGGEGVQGPGVVMVGIWARLFELAAAFAGLSVVRPVDNTAPFNV